MERMTYRELLNQLQQLNDEQLDSDVTVEDGDENECYPATFYICDDFHDSLDNEHPIIRF